MKSTSKIRLSLNWRRNLDGLIEDALRRRVFPGLELIVARGDTVALHETWGNLGIGPDAKPLRPNTVFDLASLTKPLATATATAILMERGCLSLEDRAVDFLPEFETAEKRSITLRHLLTHTSGLPALVDLYSAGQSPAQALHQLLLVPPQFPTSTAMVYSDVNFLLLAEIVRRVSGERLSELVQRSVLHPLQLNATGFSPFDGSHLIAPTQYCPYRKQVLRGIVHDENSYVLGGDGGNAGLFGTARDLHRFARMLLAGGKLEGVRILAEPTVALMTHNHNPRQLSPRGLGWDLKGEGYGYMSCGELMPAGAFGHTGFTGTSLWIEPRSRLIIIALTNRVNISREKNQPDMIRFRPRLHNLLVSALGT